MITLKIDYPPSTNTYYRHLTKGKLAGRTLISEKGRLYRKGVVDKVGCQRLIAKLDGDLDVTIDLYPPDSRRRDIDNTVKALFDALTHAQIWTDDSQVKKLTVTMFPKLDSAGSCLVTIVPRETSTPTP